MIIEAGPELRGQPGRHTESVTTSAPLRLEGQTRRYRVTWIDGREVTVEAEGMWSRRTCVEFMGMVLVHGPPR